MKTQFSSYDVSFDLPDGYTVVKSDHFDFERALVDPEYDCAALKVVTTVEKHAKGGEHDEYSEATEDERRAIYKSIAEQCAEFLAGVASDLGIDTDSIN